MPALTTSNIALPTEVAQEIMRKAQNASTIQALSPSTPALFKGVDNIVFTKEPEAEFVGEGAKKSSMEPKFEVVKGGIHKAQVTVACPTRSSGQTMTQRSASSMRSPTHRAAPWAARSTTASSMP